MRICPECNSDRLKSKGLRESAGVEYRRFKCKDCNSYFQVPLLTLPEPEVVEPPAMNERKEPKIRLITPTVDFDEAYADKAGVVITSCINDTPINEEFFKTLVKYCESKNYQLMVIPIKYINPSAMHTGQDATWPRQIHPYMIQSTVKRRDQFKIIGDCNIQATATHPLTGIDGLCEGMTSIVGHPVLQLKTVPVNPWRDPIILSSTGCISVKTQYSASKAGYRASFHHCFSAVVIEFDDDLFHLRHLLADVTGGFADLNEYWSVGGMLPVEVDAIVFGDEHVIFADEEVYEASFYGENSLTKLLKPRYMIRHDVFDAISVGKHDQNNFLNRYKKHQTPHNSIEYELGVTLDHMVNSTPDYSQTLIVHSNHDDHLQQWLSTFGDPKNDYINAKLYHHLMWKKIVAIEEQDDRSAFQIYSEDIFGLPSKVKFIPDGFSLHGIQLSMHGDRGSGGARGSAMNLSKIGERSIIGHGHNAVIQSGLFQVGLSATKAMDYAKGSPSSWMHTHCILHKNGKRQLVSIINGRFRKSV